MNDAKEERVTTQRIVRTNAELEEARKDGWMRFMEEKDEIRWE